MAHSNNANCDEETDMSNTKNAVITGASRGLGRALARELVRRKWRLIIDARSAEPLEAVADELGAHSEVVALVGDVTDAGHRAELADAAREFGGIDALVNNASFLGPSPQPEIRNYPLEVWSRVYETNVLAPVAVVRELTDVFRAEPRIVNISSDAAVHAYPGWGGYGSSKAALDHMSAVLAAENPDWRVYAVDPGDMRTQMHRAAFPDRDLSGLCPPVVSAPGIAELLEGDYESGRYVSRDIDDHHNPGLARQERGEATTRKFDIDEATGGVR